MQSISIPQTKTLNANKGPLVDTLPKETPIVKKDEELTKTLTNAFKSINTSPEGKGNASDCLLKAIEESDSVPEVQKANYIWKFIYLTSAQHKKFDFRISRSLLEGDHTSSESPFKKISFPNFSSKEKIDIFCINALALEQMDILTEAKKIDKNFSKTHLKRKRAEQKKLLRLNESLIAKQEDFKKWTNKVADATRKYSSKTINHQKSTQTLEKKIQSFREKKLFKDAQTQSHLNTVQKQYADLKKAVWITHRYLIYTRNHPDKKLVINTWFSFLEPNDQKKYTAAIKKNLTDIKTGKLKPYQKLFSLSERIMLKELASFPIQKLESIRDNPDNLHHTIDVHSKEIDPNDSTSFPEDLQEPSNSILVSEKTNLSQGNKTNLKESGKSELRSLYQFIYLISSTPAVFVSKTQSVSEAENLFNFEKPHLNQTDDFLHHSGEGADALSAYADWQAEASELLDLCKVAQKTQEKAQLIQKSNRDLEKEQKKIKKIISRTKKKIKKRNKEFETWSKNQTENTKKYARKTLKHKTGIVKLNDELANNEKINLQLCQKKEKQLLDLQQQELKFSKAVWLTYRSLTPQEEPFTAAPALKECFKYISKTHQNNYISNLSKNLRSVHKGELAPYEKFLKEPEKTMLKKLKLLSLEDNAERIWLSEEQSITDNQQVLAPLISFLIYEMTQENLNNTTHWASILKILSCSFSKLGISAVDLPIKIISLRNFGPHEGFQKKLETATIALILGFCTKGDGIEYLVNQNIQVKNYLFYYITEAKKFLSPSSFWIFIQHIAGFFKIHIKKAQFGYELRRLFLGTEYEPLIQNALKKIEQWDQKISYLSDTSIENPNV